MTIPGNSSFSKFQIITTKVSERFIEVNFNRINIYQPDAVRRPFFN